MLNISEVRGIVEPYRLSSVRFLEQWDSFN